MKYKCKLKVSNNGGDYYIGVNCFSWKYLNEYFCIEVLRGEEELLYYYKNMDMTEILNKIKNRIIKEHGQKSKEVKDAIKQIKKIGKKIIINI